MFCLFGAVLYVRNITLPLLKLCFFLLHRNYIFLEHFTLTTAAYEVRQNLQANNHDFVIDKCELLYHALMHLLFEVLNFCDI